MMAAGCNMAVKNCCRKLQAAATAASNSQTLAQHSSTEAAAQGMFL
jgi:hypothetical protein